MRERELCVSRQISEEKKNTHKLKNDEENVREREKEGKRERAEAKRNTKMRSQTRRNSNDIDKKIKLFDSVKNIFKGYEHSEAEVEVDRIEYVLTHTRAHTYFKWINIKCKPETKSARERQR